MADNNWGNPWKLTAIGGALVIATALLTGLVVANWSSSQADRKAAEVTMPPPPPPPPPMATDATPRPVTPVRPQRSVSTSAAVPTRASVDACNQYASAQVGHRDKTTEVVRDGAIGAIAGAALGAAGGAIAGGGKGAGRGAAIGGVVGAGGGSLYGLSENQKHDQYYREAYARCMRARGYAGS